MGFRSGNEHFFDVWGEQCCIQLSQAIALHCGKKQPRYPDTVLQCLLRKAKRGWKWKGLQIAGGNAERTRLLSRVWSQAYLAGEKPLFSPVPDCA